MEIAVRCVENYFIIKGEGFSSPQVILLNWKYVSINRHGISSWLVLILVDDSVVLGVHKLTSPDYLSVLVIFINIGTIIKCFPSKMWWIYAHRKRQVGG